MGATGAISLVQVRSQSGQWVSMTNTFGANWELAQAPTFPIDMRIVNDASQEVGPLVLCFAVNLPGLLWVSRLVCGELLHEQVQRRSPFTFLQNSDDTLQVVGFGLLGNGWTGAKPTNLQFQLGGPQTVNGGQVGQPCWGLTGTITACLARLCMDGVISMTRPACCSPWSCCLWWAAAQQCLPRCCLLAYFLHLQQRACRAPSAQLLVSLATLVCTDLQLACGDLSVAHWQRLLGPAYMPSAFSSVSQHRPAYPPLDLACWL